MIEETRGRRSFISFWLKALGLFGAGGVLYSFFKFLSHGEIVMKATSGSSEALSDGTGGTSGQTAGRSEDDSVELSKDAVPPGSGMVVLIAFVPVIVVNGSDGFVAFDATCTHLGCLVKWDGAANDFKCPCHGGVYDNNGGVVAGPPPAGLRRHNVSDNGVNITVSLAM